MTEEPPITIKINDGDKQLSFAIRDILGAETPYFMQVSNIEKDSNRAMGSFFMHFQIREEELLKLKKMVDDLVAKIE